MGQCAGKNPDSSHFLWETPKEDKLGKGKYSLYDLVKKYNLILDVASFPDNKSCIECITPQEDGLKVDWWKRIQSIYHRECDAEPPTNIGAFINPPGYDQEQITPWIKKCVDMTSKYPMTVIGLLPAYTDTPWFTDYIWDILPKEAIYWIPGRVNFWEYGMPKAGSPYFSSMIVRWRFK